MPPKTKKARHANDARRITATERADALFGGPLFDRATLVKAFEDHAAAALARHKAKDKSKFRAMTKRLETLLPKARKGKKTRHKPGELFIDRKGALNAEPMTKAALRQFRADLKRKAGK